MEQGQGAQTTLQMVFDAPMSSPQDSPRWPTKSRFLECRNRKHEHRSSGSRTSWDQRAKSPKRANAVKFAEYLARSDIATQMALAGVIGAT